MKRRNGELVPNEVRIIGTALLLGRSADWFHGYELLTAVEEQEGGPLLNSTTLYRALRRLEALGLLVSEWEQEDAGRRRRFYRLTDEGKSAAQEAVRGVATDRRPPWAAPLAKELGLA